MFWSKQFRIGRVVTRGSIIDGWEESQEFARRALREACAHFSKRVNVLQTPGGFTFSCVDFEGCPTGEKSTVENFEEVAQVVEEDVSDIFDEGLRKALADTCDFLTLGVDVVTGEETDDSHAELVGTYDVSKGAFVAWTGKTHPLASQARTLLYCTDLSTHFQSLNGVPVLVLGCHDLNMFSPRSRGSLAAGTYKAEMIEQMQSMCDHHRPELILQHPHFTDTPNIWRTSWGGVGRYVPSAHTWASGIHYANMDGSASRGRLKDVLASTAEGNVEDFVIDLP